MRKRWATRSSVAMGTAAVVAMAAAAPAEANNFGATDPNDGVYMADSWIQHYSFHGSWPANQRSEVDLVMSAYRSQTAVRVDPAPDNQAWGANFARVENGQAYPWLALTTCRPGSAVWGAPHHTVCQLKNIKYNNSIMSFMGAVMYQPWDNQSPGTRKVITCHEYGHSLGLRHADVNGTTETGQSVPSSHPAPANTCMHSSNNSYLGLHAHDLSHLDVHY